MDNLLVSKHLSFLGMTKIPKPKTFNVRGMYKYISLPHIHVHVSLARWNEYKYFIFQDRANSSLRNLFVKYTAYSGIYYRGVPCICKGSGDRQGP